MSRYNRSDQSRVNGAKSQGPKASEGKARSSKNAFKNGRYANNALVLANEDGGAFEELVQAPSLELENGSLPELTRLVLAGRTLVDKPCFPAYLAESETKLTFARRETLGTLQSRGKDYPRTDLDAEIQLPQPLDAEIDLRNEPETNPAQERT